MIHINTIIVGQGLAGSMLAWELINCGQSILIVDNNHKQSASITAAGIINPVTGQRLVLHSSCTKQLQYALPCYHQLEQFFGQLFYHPLPMIRIFNSHSEQLQYEKRRKSVLYNDYIGDNIQQSDSKQFMQTLGGFYQTNTGYLDITLLLKYFKLFFLEKNCYINEKLHYSNIIPTNNSIKYQSYLCDQLIFCEGHQLQNNPWFSSLPLVPTKGEILTLTSNELNSTHILNNGKWLLPIINGNFKFGATYQPNINDTQIDASNLNLLTDKLNYTVKSKFKIISQQAGIRPCTVDRDPLIGMHPSESKLGVFNGFGSKGALTIPYFSHQFSQYICARKPLPAEGNISRVAFDTENNVFG